MDEPRNALELLDHLREKDGDRVSEYNKIKTYLSFKAREKGIPLFGLFELTPLCNFDCKMCYVHLDPDQLNGQAVLPTETWKDLILQAWNAGMMYTILTGGECLAYPGFEELFLYLHSLGCEVEVLTNGLLLDEKRIKFFKEHVPTSIQVTLYGQNDDVYERVTGKRAFTAVANNIQRAVEEGLPITITITPNRYLGEDLFETIRAAKALSKNVIINSYISVPREETGRSGQRDDSEMELYIRAYKYYDKLDGHETHGIEEEKLPPCGGPCHESSKCGLRCGGGRALFAINWKGTMTPCLEMSIIRGFPLEEGFTAAWTKVNREANNWPRVPECEGCAYDKICLNCAANMLRFADPGKVPTGLCEQTRELVRHGVKHIQDCE